MCQLLAVSASGYYAWRRRPLCPRKQEDAHLRLLIAAIHRRSRGTYGAPRIRAELKFDHAVSCSGKRVLRLMRQLGIQDAHRRRYRKTTLRSPEVRAGSRSGRADIQGEPAGPALVGRYHLHPDLGGLALPGRDR